MEENTTNNGKSTNRIQRTCLGCPPGDGEQADRQTNLSSSWVFRWCLFVLLSFVFGAARRRFGTRVRIVGPVSADLRGLCTSSADVPRIESNRDPRTSRTTDPPANRPASFSDRPAFFRPETSLCTRGGVSS